MKPEQLEVVRVNGCRRRCSHGGCRLVAMSPTMTAQLATNNVIMFDLASNSDVVPHHSDRGSQSPASSFRP
jgi:hypothetical protein